MSQSTHHVTVRLARKYEFVASFPDRADGASMLFDEPAPLGDDCAPNAAAVLAAAVGNCLAASLAYCLRRARVEPEGIEARVTARIDRNERGRFRITGIDVDLEPDVAAGDVARLDRCTELFEDFCIVTESVRKGIPVKVSLKQPARVKAPAA